MFNVDQITAFENDSDIDTLQQLHKLGFESPISGDQITMTNNKVEYLNRKYLLKLKLNTIYGKVAS